MHFIIFFKKIFKKTPKTSTNLEPKVISCLPQHFRYYVRVWLHVPKHSNFFPLGSNASHFHRIQARQVMEAKWYCLLAA